ncbi:hypothetical protein, partial [Elizabethkingia argenteiflava]|uniref:hypothetical protein n=1 Tax=Elizabethkingia argenteiflava TaxID=2681556 RepID=UPI001BB3F846
EATEINIKISIDAINKAEKLNVKISYKGLGFVYMIYKIFSYLFDVVESSHKVLGRLLYLCNF